MQDYFLLCFHQRRGEVRAIAGYLVPYEYFGKINDFSVTRQNVKEELKQFELTEQTLKRLGIMKKPVVKKKTKLSYEFIVKAKERTGYFKTEEVAM
ncbi:hypothetical protein [Enterococcus xiangfangensis]|uniref:hypothetical protein n=1 Tax=Enterococcus xiangfangensis TaxID=1296537 RepID=UPI003D173BE4|nr:hypothetical protein [Enterococcus asini]